MRRTTALAAILLLSAALPSCRRPPSSAAAAKPVVFVSVLPQAYLVERIAGEHLGVEALVGSGQDPHSFEPTPKQMVLLSRAKLYFRAGVPFEDAFCGKLAAEAGQLRIVDTRRGMELRPMPRHEPEQRGAGPARRQEDRAGGELDPHVWMSPRLAKLQAKTMCEALVEAYPARRADFERNLEALLADLDRLDRRIAEALAPLKGRKLYVFHPAFGYLAADYSLVQEAVQTGGKEPSMKHVKELIDQARADGVHVIFVQPQFSTKAAETIAAEIGGVVVPLDPLAHDYLRNLEEVADRIRRGLGAKP